MFWNQPHVESALEVMIDDPGSQPCPDKQCVQHTNNGISMGMLPENASSIIQEVASPSFLLRHAGHDVGPSP